MTQEDNDLLLKDLCARLPYHVRVKVWLEYGTEEGPLDLAHNYGDVIRDAFYFNKIKDIKPYLFPMSSMTEEQQKEYDSIIYHNVELHWQRYYNVIDVDCYEELHDFYHKNQLDYRGLIPMGLAIDATGKNIY